MSVIFTTSKINKLAISILVISTLVLSFATIGLAQEGEDVNTSLEEERIEYESIGEVMSNISEADVPKEEVTDALSGLFNELATHLEEKEVPGHVVDKFEEKARSVTTMYESDALNPDQLGSEASRIVESVGRKDPEGKVPASVLEKSGMEKDQVEELNQKGADNVDPKEMAEGIVNRKREKIEERKQEEAEDKDEERVKQQDRAEKDGEAPGKSSEQESSNSRGRGNGEVADKGRSNRDVAGPEKEEEVRESASSAQTERPDEAVSQSGDRGETGEPDNKGKPDKDKKEDSKGNSGKGKGRN